MWLVKRVRPAVSEAGEPGVFVNEKTPPLIWTPLRVALPTFLEWHSTGAPVFALSRYSVRGYGKILYDNSSRDMLYTGIIWRGTSTNYSQLFSLFVPLPS